MSVFDHRSRHTGGEHGAVAVVVAICMLLFVAAAAIAIDLGSGWNTQRDLVIDTDAGSLAGARLLSDIGIDECAPDHPAVLAEIDAVVGLNDPDTMVDEVDIECHESFATVRVAGSKVAPHVFAPAVANAFDNLDVAGTSTAIVGPAGFVQNLLPLGLCRDLAVVEDWDPLGDPLDWYFPIQEYLAADNAEERAERAGPHEIEWLGGLGDLIGGDCLESVGNWGWLSFHQMTAGTGTCGGDNLDQLRAMICQGYGGGVQLEPDYCGYVPEGTSTDPNPDFWCWARTGNINSAHQQLDNAWLCEEPTDVDDCPKFAALIYDDLRGGGTNLQFRPVAFLGVVLRESQQNPPNGWILTLEFTDITVQGNVGNVTHDTGVTTYELCGAGERENCVP
jgi:hypothetical protein